MFKQSKENSIFISAEKGLFIFNGKEMPAGNEIQATIKDIRLLTDPGSKEHKIKAGEKVILTLESPDTTAKLNINLNGFTGIKILCLMASLESPYLSLSMKKKLGDELPSVFIGSRADEETTQTTWHKSKFTFDSDKTIFNRDSKEIISAADLLESVADLLNVPFIDQRAEK